jgi:hypothetical protein
MTHGRIGLLVAAFAATALPAGAAPLVAADIQSRIAGGEFRGYFANGAYFENHIWRFAPDGSVRAVYDRVRSAAQQSTVRESGSDTGRWTVEGNQLCVQFQIILDRRKSCYAVDAREGSQVRLIGAQAIEGTITR